MQDDDYYTSTTAPGHVFTLRSELAQHYQSDWHKYNLKRRQAGLPLLGKVDFEARLEAAQALAAEKQWAAQQKSKDHLKKNKKKKGKKEGVQTVSQAGGAYDRIKQESQEQDAKQETQQQASGEGIVEPMETNEEAGETTAEEIEQQPSLIAIEPRQSLFDRHISSNVQSNVNRMYQKFGFFVPDREYLTDLQGLIGYCHEVVRLGHTCLYCYKTFKSVEACQGHMISKRHTKLRYEAGVDLEDLAVFYDFSDADAEFLGCKKVPPLPPAAEEDDDGWKDAEGGDAQDGWEDVTDDEAEVVEELGDDDIDDDDEEDDDLEGYSEQVASMGLDVTPLGELVFPDGRIVGHRSLRRYYKQRLAPTEQKVSVQAARHAAGERIVRGRVLNLNGGGGAINSQLATLDRTTNLAARVAGVGGSTNLKAAASSRLGRGLLVKNASNEFFSQLSIYRYRAAIRKERRGQVQHSKQVAKQYAPQNKMDKKWNRLANGVSVAHAAR